MKTLSGTVILITGAAGGIGAATAQRLSERGATLVLCDLDPVALKEAAVTLTGEHLVQQVDVTDLDQCISAVDAAVAAHGRLDYVWANAGISAFAPLELMDAAAWHKVVEVNLLGAYNIVKAALPQVISARGYVALTASGASFAHSPGHSAYAASKAGLEALGNSLRSELADRGVAVGVFHPQWIRTPMVTEKRDHNDAFNVLLNALPKPMRILVEVDDMADVLVTAFERRSERVIHPRIGWLLYALRPLLPLAPFTARTRKVAPEIRRAFQAQHAQDSAGRTGLPDRYR